MKQSSLLGTSGSVNWEAGRDKGRVISCGAASDFPAEKPSHSTPLVRESQNPHLEHGVPDTAHVS